MSEAAWDGRDGTAGGVAFGKGLAALAADREVPHESLAEAAGLEAGEFAKVLSGERRVGVSALARFASALRTRPVEFLQRTAILSLESYAFGLIRSTFSPKDPCATTPGSTCARSIRAIRCPKAI